MYIFVETASTEKVMNNEKTASSDFEIELALFYSFHSHGRKKVQIQLALTFFRSLQQPSAMLLVSMGFL